MSAVLWTILKRFSCVQHLSETLKPSYIYILMHFTMNLIDPDICADSVHAVGRHTLSFRFT